MIQAALILTLLVPSVSDRSRATPAFDGVFSFDADLDGNKLYGDKTDDSNTYIYRSGADEWTVVSGGVDALICDASYCTFTSGPKVGASIPFADAAGTLTLQNIDALDATTETTIESAIDTLPNLVYPPSTTITCSGDAASVNWALYTSAIVDFGDEGAAGCTITFSNMAAGRAIYLKVIQDGDGGNATFAGCTFHWPSASPVITPIDNAYDLISCFSFDGSTCDCSIIQDMK